MLHTIQNEYLTVTALEQGNLFSLKPDETYRNRWSIRIHMT